jgi:kynurenine formamidase
VVEFAPKPDPNEALIPPIHFMQASGDNAAAEGHGGAHDWAGLPLHGLYLTHLDAHSHVFFNAQFYNGQKAGTVFTDRGATRGGVDLVRNGIVSRGILLDVAKARGVNWMDGNDGATGADMEAAEALAGVRVEAGDVVLVRTGYGRRRIEHAREPWQGQPGVNASILPWVHARQPSVLGTDTATDPIGGPRPYPHVGPAVHAICMVAMGMWIIDGCDLEQLAQTCQELGRYEFMFITSPLRLKNSTGSPINPLAVF